MKTTIAIGILLAASRVWLGVTVEPETFNYVSAYKDAAHLFMGGLAVAWWNDNYLWQWNLFWFLNAVEIAVAIASRM